MLILKSAHLFNQFVPNDPSLPSEIIRIPYSFLMLLGGRERVHWERMGYGGLELFSKFC